MSDAIHNSEPLFDLSSLNLPNLSDPTLSNERPRRTDGEKFVVFFLDDELFAVSARQVAEVVRPLPLTPLPDAPAWLCGVANLRGEIVSVISLAQLFKKRSAPASAKNKLVVLKPQHAAAALAFPVDRLSELVTFAPRDIAPADDFRLLGQAVHDARPVRLLDPDQLFVSLL